MDERNMEKEGQNGKRKEWCIERKILLFLLELKKFAVNTNLMTNQIKF
jgi:hypothetical protein